MKTKVEKLEWDSSFFGYNVGSVTLEDFDLSEYSVLKELIKSQKFCVTYLYPSTSDITEVLKLLKLPFVDNKVTFVKKILIKIEDNYENLESFESDDLPDELLMLVFDSGEFSRFKVDRNFKNHEFEKLYIEWIQRSINKEIADEVFIIKEMKKIKGFLTYKSFLDKVKIGLIAINKESRGKGYGRKLLNFLENKVLEKDINLIEVVTQGANISACHFYESCGYKIIKEQPIFHLWMET